MSELIIANRYAFFIAYKVLFLVWGNLVFSKYFGEYSVIEYKKEWNEWFPHLSLLVVVYGYFVDFFYSF